MDFRDAVTRLTERIRTEDIAAAAGVSLYSIRQARLHGESEAYRTPPENWQAVVARLAREREEHFRQLAEELEK